MMNLKEFLQILKYYFFTTLHLVVAFLLLWGLFYIRFLPRVSRDLWQQMTTYQISLVLFTLFCIILAIISTLKQLNVIEIKESSAMVKAYRYPITVTYDYILAVLANLYDFIWFVFEKLSKTFFQEPCLHLRTLLPLVKSFTNKKYSIYYFIFLLSVKLLPIIMFVAALLYDVFLCKRFDYTFRCIPLLIIPLIEPIFLYIMKDYYKCHLLNLASFLIFVEKDNKIIGTRLAVKKEKLPYGAKNHKDFVDNYFYPVDQILLTIEKYEAWKTETVPTYYILLTLQILRLSAYCYILIYGIF